MPKQIPNSGTAKLPFRVKVCIKFRLLLAMDIRELVGLFSIYKALVSCIQKISITRAMRKDRNSCMLVPYYYNFLTRRDLSSYVYYVFII